MLNSIQPLPTEVINQIAAGEVVERPAHLIKELIENSLDAKASKIEIHFSQGGQCVQVKDNGVGIKSDQLLLAIAPHSTSKIKSVQDIWGINSYGFRGEALASIASVSDLTLISKIKNAKNAYRIKSEFGKQTAAETIGAEQGTTLIIKDLFKNVPARLKFLKSETSETTLIKNTIKAMAINHPSVEFRVLYKNKLLFYWPALKNIQQRVENILSLKNTFYTKLQYQDIYGEAVLCAPHQTLSNRKQMWFFVEKRWIEDTTLYAAVMSAYRGLLMHKEYPIIVINIQCPKQDLDVNVHPTKSKIRFKNTAPVFKAVHHGIRSILEKAPWIDNQNQTKNILKKENSFKEQETELNFLNKSDNNTFLNKKKDNYYPPSYVENLNKIKPAFFNTPLKNTASQTNAVLQTSAPPVENKTISTYWSSLDILSQAYLTYIVAQNRDGLVFIDQHAAHERILYEKFMLYWNTGKGEIQNRLIPLALDLEEPLIKALLSVQKELVKIGITTELSGPNELLIHSAPAVLKDTALKKSLLQLAEEKLSLGDTFAIEKQISDLCATMACHTAIRAGQALSPEEIKQLLIQMDSFALSSFCPHGRPVFVEYPLLKLEKDFGRKI